jgi:hypothetical protein
MPVLHRHFRFNIILTNKINILLKQIEKKMIFLLDSFFQEIKLIIDAEI